NRSRKLQAARCIPGAAAAIVAGVRTRGLVAPRPVGRGKPSRGPGRSTRRGSRTGELALRAEALASSAMPRCARARAGRGEKPWLRTSTLLVLGDSFSFSLLLSPLADGSAGKLSYRIVIR